MTGRSCAALLLVLTAGVTLAAQEPVPAGRVKVVTGPAFVIHLDQQIPAVAGTPVFEHDRLFTGPGGRMGVTLRDDTRLSIGPQTTIEINRFLYAPSDSQFSFVLRVVRGVVAYVSGRIAKLSPDAVRLETPAAIVGVRGTRVVMRVAE